MEANHYQIIIVNLDPIGSEIKKTWPYIVISPDKMNRHFNTMVIAPLTSTRKNYPNDVRALIENKVSRIALSQICNRDKIRIVRTRNQISTKEIIEAKSIIEERTIYRIGEISMHDDANHLFRRASDMLVVGCHIKNQNLIIINQYN